MKQGKILLVDDNQGIRSALKILLPAHFAQVEIIASPKSLVSTMENYRPDVVLLDMNFYTDITYIPASTHNEATLSGAWTFMAQQISRCFVRISPI